MKNKENNLQLSESMREVNLIHNPITINVMPIITRDFHLTNFQLRDL